MNIRTPGTPGASDPDDVKIDIDVNRDKVLAVSSSPLFQAARVNDDKNVANDWVR